MPVPTDPFNFSNGATADADQVDARFLPLYTALAGALDDDNVDEFSEAALAEALLVKLGLTGGGLARRGKCIIPGSESRTNVAYGLLATPDEVADIVLPTDGLIFVAYQALWQSSVNNAGVASLFLGANQVKAAQAGAVPQVVEPSTGATGSLWGVLCSSYIGLTSAVHGSQNTGDNVTTGQAVGMGNGISGVCAIFAAAGTYDVSVRFKASSGSVTAKDRRLWVWTLGF
jgi:hypothetical protein